jgi:pyridinium-3,5-biscarboxylic acid mononucleotide synthase
MATNEVTLDFARTERIGFEEAIFCQGKTDQQLAEILDKARARGASLLLTRLSVAQLDGLPATTREALDYEPVSRTAFFGPPRPVIGSPRIAIVAAGSSDTFVTREVARTLTYSGVPSTSVVDVGVAGLWRLLDRVDVIKAHPIVIAVAGMDAALPTVIGGLVGSVVIAVPTSTGYGVAQGGHAALNAILSSCAPGVTVLNIDNG